MHRYLKKLNSESSSPLTFISENSPLNQETSQQNTQTQAPNFDLTTNPSFGRSQVDLSALQLDSIEKNRLCQLCNIVCMTIVKFIISNHMDV